MKERSNRARQLGLALSLAGLLASCGEASTEHERPPPEVLPGWVAAPAFEDTTGVCADVASARACWSAEGPVRVARPRPPFDAPGGWRCVGTRRERRCTARRTLASPFECDETGCQQRHPYLPDHGQWECMEEAGLTICRSVGEAAGLPPSERNAGWSCGARRAGSGETLCIDTSPDRPAAQPARYRCRFDHESGERRRCTVEVGQRIGDACEAPEECPAGSSCIEHACLPRAPFPECWIDDDCEGGRCRLARCEAVR